MSDTAQSSVAPVEWESIPAMRPLDADYRYTETSWDGVARDYSPSGCKGAFNLFGKKANIWRAGGNVGDKVFEAESIGTLQTIQGKKVYAKVTLDGDAGTYEAEIKAGGSVPSSTDTTKYVTIAEVDEKGNITYQRCTSITVTVCRNWYAAESPYYTISAS